jgi:hypothetical protein
VYLTKIIGVERIKENTHISICGTIFGLVIEAKKKNETKRIGFTCQGITKPKEFETHFQSKGS